ncbi:MAG TPA: hypothetical protein VL095_07590 [Flavisolibacter sp.]|nr:hypothetical protein [Flavisolibacter sp.]
MKTFIISIVAWFLLASCNNSNEHTNINTSDSLPANADQNSSNKPDLSGCYLRVIKRDTLALRLEEKNGAVTGKLSFDNYEKDGSTGTVKGTVENNIVKLIYDFQSEGMHSVMDIYFKITDKGLIQGIGEVAPRGDTTAYTNPDKVDYPADNELLKISCDVLDDKYK